MKIGIDCRLWNETGVGRYTKNLVHELQAVDKKNSYTLFVLTRDYDQVLSAIDNRKKWTLVTADVRWHTLAEQLRFPAIIASEELDLVHFPYFSVPIFYHKKFVVTIHDLILNHYPTGKASTLPAFLYWIKQIGYRFVIQEAARKSDFIITVSNATKNEIVSYFDVDPSRVAVTYEGVDSKISNFKFPISNKKADSSKYFLYVGNAYPHKNLERLLDAFSIFHQQYPVVKLKLIGKEDYFYKRLKKKIKNTQLEESVELLGYVSDKKLAELYSNCVAVVCPSLMEGFGLPGLEAMEHGALVLAAKIPVYKEIYQDNCLYFNPHSTKDIQRSLQEGYLLSKEKREQFVRSETQYARNFSWKKMAQETLAIYNKVEFQP